MSTAALLDDARAALADAPREALGELVEPRRVLGIARAAAHRPPRRRLAPRACCSSPTTPCSPRATSSAPGRRRRAGFTAESQRRRAELAAAARRGGFAEGETVHIGWRMLDLDAVDRGAASGPLALRDGVPSVRWSAAGGYVPLDAYLDERIELLRHPPAGRVRRQAGPNARAKARSSRAGSVTDAASTRPAMAS